MSEKENLFSTILDSVQSLKSPYAQAITLLGISAQFFRLNDIKKSDEFFNKALNVGKQISNNLEQLNILQQLVGMLVNVVKKTNDKEKLELAIELSKSIYLPYNRLYNLLDLLKIFFPLLGKDITLGLINEIVPTIDEITSKSYSFELLSEVVSVLCDMGVVFNDLELIQQAQQYLEQLDVSSFYYIALLSIAKAFLSYAETNQDLTWISNTQEYLTKLPEMSLHTTALIDVSLALLRMKKENQAEEMIETAIDYAEKIEETSKRSVALSYIAKALIKLNKQDKAKQKLLTAVEAAQTITDQKLLNMAWQSVIEAINDLSSGDKLSLIQEIVETVEKLSDVRLRAFAFNYIITALNEGDQIEKSSFQGIMRKAVTTVESIRNKLVRETAAITLVGVLMEKSSEITDDFIFNMIFELTEQIKDPRNAIYLFTDIAHVSHSFRREKEVEDLLEGARQFIHQLPSVLEKARALIYVAKGCLELGLKNKFHDLIAEATELVNEIEISNELVFVLTNVAKLLAQGNEKERAMHFLRQTLEISNELPNELEKSDALSSIVEIVLTL